jgi:hypothetical protein
MGQPRKRLAILLVILSISIVATVTFLGVWFNTKSTSPNSAITEPPILEPSSPYLPTPSPVPSPTYSPTVELLWQKIGNDIKGEAAFDRSGWSVSLSSDGKTVAVGAPWNDGNAGAYSGHVRIFQWTESTSAWTQVGADIDGEESVNQSGRSVSLSSDGKTVAVGAPWNDGNGVWSGHVRIFQWTESTSAWT